jgi:antitoxin component HigA of HigAB toxin-antitoxin module
MMIRLLQGLTIVLYLATISLFAQQTAEAVQYLNAVGNEFQAVSKNMMSYTSAAAHGKGARKVEKTRQGLLNQIKEAERNMRRMRPFQNDASLRDTVVLYFNMAHSVLSEDFGKIIDLEDVAEQSYDAMEAYLLAKELASKKLDRASEMVAREQDKFTKAHNIKVVENTSKLNQKLEASGKVIKYYNEIYLIFFKSFKDEVYLMEALQQGDVNQKEQTKNALLNSATTGLQKLGPIPPFKGDASLKAACQQLLNFYKQEASTGIPLVIDFDLKKENFEKIKKAFDAKRPNERTQTDVDLYSKTVKEYNDAVGKVNTVQNDLNKKRAQTLDHWNKMTDQFLSRHVPRY